MQVTDGYINRGSFLITFSYLLRIISLGIFSHFFIKFIKLYKHHYVSFIFIIITLIIINVSTFLIYKFGKKSWSFRIFFSEIIFAFSDVLGSIYLNKSEGNIGLLFFITSIFHLIVLIILHIIFSILNTNDVQCDTSSFFDIGNSYFFCNNKKFKYFYDNFNLFGNIFTFLYLFSLISLEIIKWYLIYLFSPNHYGAIYSIYSLFITSALFQIHNSEILKERRNPLYLIGCLLISFFVMVYNEIIILRFCGLDKNTKEEIANRAFEESKLEEIENNFNNKENEEKINELNGEGLGLMEDE